MKDGIDDLVLRAVWRNRPLNGGEYLAWVKGFMRKLGEVHPKLREMYVVARRIKQSVVVSADTPNFDEVIIANLNPALAYRLPDGGHKDAGSVAVPFCPEAITSLGFQTGLSTSIKAGPSMAVSIDIGRQPQTGNRIVFNDTVLVVISANSDLCEVAKQLFVAIIDYARPEQAMLKRRSVVAFPSQPVGSFHVGWLTYFADPNVGTLVPEDINTESLAGGVLIQASDHLPMPTDVAEVARISRIFHALHDAGALAR